MPDTLFGRPTDSFPVIYVATGLALWHKVGIPNTARSMGSSGIDLGLGQLSKLSYPATLFGLHQKKSNGSTVQTKDASKPEEARDEATIYLSLCFASP
eukprot:1136268-Pelagomonas_calceolata.AAC.2